MFPLALCTDLRIRKPDKAMKQEYAPYAGFLALASPNGYVHYGFVRPVRKACDQ